ncbi:unnamed protein product [Oppiella nova]|uniref:Serine/threonine-protein kinase 40 n=1 Tax=Oppiella nova TaxID=334625 RepID=A0A7R9MF32_9ACAR|nr:unnamed protein product [Oppiella nova]CAG2175212.1 unnamed protein product [Oppiella nova]
MEDSYGESQDDRQGKMLLHTEYSLLSLLHDMPGVIHHWGLFKDEALEEREVSGGQWVYTGNTKKRICLVLDCLWAHDFSPKSVDLVNLQHHVIKEKKLPEREALRIFLEVVRIVRDLHQRNIVHRDLKLGNMVYNRRARTVTLINFCLGKHLISENDLLTDQRGSPAYISPDVLSGKPYLGKASDCWALGVVLYTMLFGQFPFYDSVPQELFRKIKSAEYSVPKESRVSGSTISIIHKLLVLSPRERMTAEHVLDALHTSLSLWLSTKNMAAQLQVVPDIDHQLSDCNDNKADESAANECQKSQLKTTTTREVCAVSGYSHPSGGGNRQDVPVVVEPSTSGSHNTRHTYVRLTSGRMRTTPIGTLPIRRIESDAKTLTLGQMMMLKRYVSNGGNDM